MTKRSSSRSGYLRGLILLFLFGFAAGLSFPLLLWLLLDQVLLPTRFWAVSFGYALLLGGVFLMLAHLVLKRQMLEHLELLQGLTGNRLDRATGTIESVSSEVARTVASIQAFVAVLRENTEQAAPHYKSLMDASRFLLARAEDGMQAAENARADVESMFEKQKAVLGEVSVLSDQSQDEAALSRELSASLEEIAGALDRSNIKFQETTRSVDELVEATQESTRQADQLARTMEGTAEDLDKIGQAFNELRNGVESSANNADAVNRDAEQGLKVVETFISEMSRIEESGQQAQEAMQRLAHQTDDATRIIEVIKSLVSDTELLAFNAAIIAAKAGSEGRGFSVVAEEMRELADRTANSADEIEGIVRNIREETARVNNTVDDTSQFISRGTALSETTGSALQTILDSSRQAAQESHQLAAHSADERKRARALLEDAGDSLRSVRAIAQSMQQQEAAISRIDAGVDEMKAAADQIARGFDEQVKANREFDRSMLSREEQVRAINGATQFQMKTVEQIFEHFNRSSERLVSNAEKSRIVLEETTALEELTVRLREKSLDFSQMVQEQDNADASLPQG